jgi:protein SCO1/2
MRTLLAGMLLLMSPWAGAAEDSREVTLYDLRESLTIQDGQAVGLDVHRGSKVLVTMFYSGCQATCPLIIDTLRAVEHKLGATQRSQLRVLLISFDPERDTIEVLRELAATRRIDTRRWTVARADAAAVRRIAAALDIAYRRLPAGQISHANVITVLGTQGEILARSTELGAADAVLLEALRKP